MSSRNSAEEKESTEVHSPEPKADGTPSIQNGKWGAEAAKGNNMKYEYGNWGGDRWREKQMGLSPRWG